MRWNKIFYIIFPLLKRIEMQRGQVDRQNISCRINISHPSLLQRSHTGSRWWKMEFSYLLIVDMHGCEIHIQQHGTFYVYTVHIVCYIHNRWREWKRERERERRSREFTKPSIFRPNQSTDWIFLQADSCPIYAKTLWVRSEPNR